MTDLIVANAARWRAAKITRANEFRSVAVRLVAGKPRYQEIEKLTGVPWFITAVIHEREASQNWNSSIAQGDPWNRESTHDPRGRGPFASFKDAAVDALTNCAPYAAKWKDWSAGGGLTILERYNGLGYANKGRPSPYVWSGTDQYVKGKYVSDGLYDPEAVDKQLGCAGLILAMQALDMSVRWGGAIPAPPDIEPAPVQPPKSPIEIFIAFILSFFKKG